jgi:polyadenylate-binding protein
MLHHFLPFRTNDLFSHRVIKSFGLKQAPKLTIALLDGEDLRALAHLMNSYSSVLKEKAILLQASLPK